MKDSLRALFLAALQDLDVGAATARVLARDDRQLRVDGVVHDLAALRQVFVLAIGKAARPMATAVLPFLHGLPVRGLCVPPRRDDDGAPLPPLQVVGGGHPVPDEHSLHAAERALVLLGDAGERDLVLFLISGGGSALCERPLVPAVPLRELQQLHERLVAGGADIVAMNALRKRVSGVKGGRLALRAAPAMQHTLLVSDVPVDRPDAIASGPTLPDRGDPTELDAALTSIGGRQRLPPGLRALLRQGHVAPLPPPDHRAFSRSHHSCVLDQRIALSTLAARAEALGLATHIVPTQDTWTTTQLADAMLGELAAQRAAQPDRAIAVLAGGELSVPLPERPGTGGRNQQFVLHVAQRIQGQRLAVLSAGTDGRDGKAPAAGAIADGSTVARAVALGLDPARHERTCDAHPLFEALGDLVIAPAGNNVRDLRIVAAGP